jgi:hypothetical protein
MYVRGRGIRVTVNPSDEKLSGWTAITGWQHESVVAGPNGRAVPARGLDIFALAGGDLKAYVKELVGMADGAGTIVVSILGDATKTLVNPFLNAIEVLIARYSIYSGGTE